MFTGIVEDIGRIKRLAADRLEIISCLDGVKPGDSIAVNGVCLTVTGLDGGWFFDLMPFTLRDTALAGLPVGAAVNLERAMPADGRFGGHFVSGHVDEASPVEKIDAAAGKILWIRAGRENKKFLARK
ncbi:MAG: riboflavin synthase, partial [Candidatus Margulisbacteria bacterium]|nr:riboflavin synthase [Candidatus Margulisiibacteriota bacterium]